MASGKIVNVDGHPFPIEWHRVSFTAADFEDNTEVDSGYELPTDGIVLPWGVFVEVLAKEETATTKAADVGLLSSEAGGDADGLLDGISLAATGIVKPTLASAGQTLGALLRADEDGSGALVPEGHVLNGTARTVSATFGDAGGATEAAFDVYIPVLRPLGDR